MEFLSQKISEDSTVIELAQWYFDTIAPKGLKEHTIFNNQSLISNYVLPYIGTKPVREISPVIIDELLSFLMERGALRPNKKLSDSTIRQIRIAASSVFQTAVQKEIIDRNPVALSTKLRIEKSERNFLDEHSCKKILFLCNSLSNPQIANAIRLLLLTGMRRGELIGLCWGDIDFRKREISIRRTVSQFNGSEVVTTPKTLSSQRTIKLCGSAISVLKKQKDIRESFTKEAGIKKNEYVFSNKEGGFLSGAYLNNCFRKMMADAGMPGFHIHDLRHANASILINNGVPMKLVSRHLGHSSVAITEEFYTHLFQDSLKMTANMIERRLCR